MAAIWKRKKVFLLAERKWHRVLKKVLSFVSKVEKFKWNRRRPNSAINEIRTGSGRVREMNYRKKKLFKKNLRKMKKIIIEWQVDTHTHTHNMRPNETRPHQMSGKLQLIWTGDSRSDRWQNWQKKKLLNMEKRGRFESKQEMIMNCVVTR